jgi:hypothetical protein
MGERDKVSTSSGPIPRSAPTPPGRRPLWAMRLEGGRASGQRGCASAWIRAGGVALMACLAHFEEVQSLVGTL